MKLAGSTSDESISQSLGTCFVIMPFGEPFDGYYRGLYVPAVRKVGLTPKRGDDLFGSSSIIDDVWTMIKAATILIADLRTGNPNVYYELGLAHALGKPVLLVASSLEHVPFDLRHLRRLIYNKEHPSWEKS